MYTYLTNVTANGQDTTQNVLSCGVLQAWIQSFLPPGLVVLARLDNYYLTIVGVGKTWIHNFSIGISKDVVNGLKCPINQRVRADLNEGKILVNERVMKPETTVAIVFKSNYPTKPVTI